MTFDRLRWHDDGLALILCENSVREDARKQPDQTLLGPGNWRGVRLRTYEGSFADSIPTTLATSIRVEEAGVPTRTQGRYNLVSRYVGLICHSDSSTVNGRMLHGRS